ncbi:hypothetical protein AAMO2058_001051500 [Amorphochlora amoebiformis]
MTPKWLSRVLRPKVPALSKTYDYVIVGAGSAGCLLANRLSKDPKNKVLLVEAGSHDKHFWVHVPVGYLYTMGDQQTSWGYHTEPQPGMSGRSIAYPRGRLLGGCSSINGMIYQRGQERDYNRWELEHKNPGWNWSAVSKYFNNMLDYDIPDGNPDYKRGGEWHVEPPRVRWEVLDSFIEGAKEIGIPEIKDFNHSDRPAVGYFQVNQRKGVRLSSYRAFIHPILHRPNLNLLTDHLTKRVEISQTEKKVTGLDLLPTDGGEAFRVHATKEIILSAGAIGSPQILMLSGVGDPRALTHIGIEPKLDLPGVGQNLHDHLQIRTAFRLHRPGILTLNQLANSPWGQLKMGLQYLTTQTGPLSMAPSQVGMFAKSNEEEPTPNIQYHVQPLSLDSFGKPLHEFPGMTLSVCNLRPTSRGSVTLTSNDPKDKPKIDPNYLSTEYDRRVASESIRHARKLAGTNAVKALQPEEIVPGSSIQTDEDLAKSAGGISASIFHPVGTCRMGPKDDKKNVVDNTLTVHGLQGLRVVDASIMPSIVSGNTNSPTLMIAEKAADMILGNKS